MKIKNKLNKSAGSCFFKTKYGKNTIWQILLPCISLLFFIVKKMRYNKYKQLCLEMAKIDHDIAFYYTDIMQKEGLYKIKLKADKKDIEYRYKLYIKTNKGKLKGTLKQDKEELVKRRKLASQVYQNTEGRIRGKYENSSL